MPNIFTDCKRMTQLTSLSYETPLTPTQKVALNMHLMFCPECRRFRKNSDVLSKMTKKFGTYDVQIPKDDHTKDSVKTE